MANEITLTSKVDGASVTIKNGALQTETKRIVDALNDAKNSLLVVAYTLNKIKTGKLYAADGFADIYDYGNVVFGYKKAMVANLCRVGANYLVSDNGAIKSIMAHSDNDYSVSQIQEVLPISVDDAKTLDSKGEITPEMTTKEIRDVVKDFKSGGKTGEGDGNTATEKAASVKQLQAAIDRVYNAVEILNAAATADERAAMENALDAWGAAATVVVERVKADNEKAKAAAKAAKAAANKPRAKKPRAKKSASTAK